MLIDIGWNPYVKGGMHDEMTRIMRVYMNTHPTLYDIAIRNALFSLGVPQKPTSPLKE